MASKDILINYFEDNIEEKMSYTENFLNESHVNDKYLTSYVNELKKAIIHCKEGN